MELPGAAYFYTVATVAITFVTFSSLLIVLRQSVGGEFSKFDTTPVTRLFIQLGFIAVVGAMLPPMLALCDVPSEALWRISSGVPGALILLRGATWPRQRRRQVGPKVPRVTYVYLAVGFFADAILLSNAAGVPWHPQLRLHAFGLTLYMFNVGASFLGSSKLVLEGSARAVRPTPDAERAVPRNGGNEV